MTASGAFIDSSDSAAIIAQITTLAVAGNLIIIVPTMGINVWIGKTGL